MLCSEKAGVQKVAGNPLPPKIAALLRESWWLALVAIAAYLLLILLSFNAQDPSWSQSTHNSVVRNWGGAFGAYLADILLLLFGRSAYWLDRLCGVLVAWAFRRIEVIPAGDKRSYIVAIVGFTLLLVASSGIEAIIRASIPTLPHAPGGIIRSTLKDSVGHAFGAIGGTVILLVVFAAGARPVQRDVFAERARARRRLDRARVRLRARQMAGTPGSPRRRTATIARRRGQGHQEEHQYAAGEDHTAKAVEIQK